MGCPVPKVCKTGAGAAMLEDPDTAVAVARAAREGSGLPVTVKLRSGSTPGDTSGFELAHRLVAEAGVAAIAFHPRSRQGPPQGHARLRAGGRAGGEPARAGDPHRRPARPPTQVRDAYARTGAAAVMLARGALGNPWLFEELLGRREGDPHAREVLAESTG